jgi:transcriptional regulator with XRE-family HTH domain
MTFSEKLVKLRKLKGVTQDQFATVIGVSRQAVFKWESGQSYPEALKLLAIRNFFGETVSTVDQLIDDECEIVFPEKPKRRRRAAEKSPVDAPAATVAEADVETETVVENVTTEAPVEAVAAEAPATEVKEEIKEEPKKKGFWGRLFGR